MHHKDHKNKKQYANKICLKLAALFDADDVQSGKAQAATSRRKERIGKLRGYFKQGLIGVNRNALVEVIAQASSGVKALASAENKDRKIMQEEVANKNKTNLAGVRRVFFEDEYKRAPKGFYFEIYDRKKDTYTWTRK